MLHSGAHTHEQWVWTLKTEEKAMSNGKNSEALARLFKLQATVGKLVLDGKRTPEEVCALLQQIIAKTSTPCLLLRAQIEGCTFKEVDENVLKQFRFERPRMELRECQFNKNNFSIEAVTLLPVGWHPANLSELLEHSKHRWDGKGKVVALGSSEVIGGRRMVPYITKCSTSQRCLRLGLWNRDWSRYTRFLAARD